MTDYLEFIQKQTAVMEQARQNVGTALETIAKQRQVIADQLSTIKAQEALIKSMGVVVTEREATITELIGALEHAKRVTEWMSHSCWAQIQAMKKLTKHELQ